MTAVKGSKQYRMVVVTYRPVWRWLFRGTLLLVAAAAVAASYWYGLDQGLAMQAEALSERDRLRTEL